MHALGETTRNRWTLPVLILVWVVALLLGGTVGYLVKPSSAPAGASAVLAAPDGGTYSSNSIGQPRNGGPGGQVGDDASSGDGCLLVNGHKGC